MKRAIVRGLPILCGFGLLLRAAPARAADPVQLTYVAPEGCPSETSFRAAVTERGGHFDDASSPGSVRGLRISIGPDEHGFRGSLQSSSTESSSAVRDVHGVTCQEVVDALAVVSALTLRGEAQPPPTLAAEPAPGPTPAVMPMPTPTLALDADHRLRANGTVRNERMQVSAGTLSFDKVRAISVVGGGELRLLPGKVVPRLDLSLDVASFVTTPNGKSYLDGIVPRVRLSYLGQTTRDFGNASATMEGFSFGMALCWSPTYDTHFLARYPSDPHLARVKLLAR